MRIFLAIVIFTSFILSLYGQKNDIRLPNEYLINDSTKFPFANYLRVESYSFNRKERTELKIKYELIKQEIEDSSIRVDSSRIGEFLSIQNEYLQGESSIVYKDRLAETAEKVKTLDQNQLKELRKLFILKKDKQHEELECWPIYRDALIFYSRNNDIVAILDICFECRDIRANPQFSFRLKKEQWVKLEDFFKNDLKHPIE